MAREGHLQILGLGLTSVSTKDEEVEHGVGRSEPHVRELNMIEAIGHIE